MKSIVNEPSLYQRGAAVLGVTSWDALDPVYADAEGPLDHEAAPAEDSVQQLVNLHESQSDRFSRAAIKSKAQPPRRFGKEKFKIDDVAKQILLVGRTVGCCRKRPRLDGNCPREEVVPRYNVPYVFGKPKNTDRDTDLLNFPDIMGTSASKRRISGPWATTTSMNANDYSLVTAGRDTHGRNHLQYPHH
jgi:hypothetical protein